MKQIYLVLLSGLMLAVNVQAQQQILLLTETFESNANAFELDSGGVGGNSGNNRWVINNQYNGQPLYPNTPPQDSIVSGTINAAPFSTYLHIHDQTATGNGIANANWNTNSASDRFAYLKRSFCTLGMTNVIFTFFWICEGDANAYGEVYYRIDGGPWIQTGLPKYNNQSKWKYEVIQDPAFNNVQNLQFGFRWVNPSGGTSNVSFGVDDIIAVGTYDNVNNPITINITSVSPTTVCQDNFLIINYQLSAPVCDGVYRIEMSDANGNFTNPVNGGVFSINAPQTTGSIGFQVPDNVQGTCFKVRINRISPEPVIIGEASVCFTIIDCPETIVTQSAPVMNDPDTACILSVIDVRFNSFGVFNQGNVYIAELSDANGSFSNPYQLGTNPTRQSFPAMPGNVSGLIPASVPPGCGYFIRVRSTSPAVTGSVIGPFCLTRCDELTNNTQDIKLCVSSLPFPPCSTINIKPNQWNQGAAYDTCNNWTVELRNMMTFGLVNTGGLGIYPGTQGGNFQLCVPSTVDSLPVAPGSYYLRIISNCSNQPWNQTGSVIRITIGAPSATPPTIITDDTVYCNAGLVNLLINPYNQQSKYEWVSNGLNNGLPFIWDFNPLIVDFTGAPLNQYNFFVREINFGCYGPYSDPASIDIIGIPDVNISGPVQVCLGDTVTFKSGFLKETYYDWNAPPGVEILEEGNSEVSMIFNNLGTFELSNFTLNKCGGDSGTYSVKVVTLYNVNAGADKSVCEGEEFSLNVLTDKLDKVFVTQDTATQGRQGAMFNIIARDDVVIDSFSAKFLTTQPIQIEIYGKSGSYRTFEQDQFAWNQLGSYFNFTPAPLGQMTVIPVEVSQTIAKGDTFAFYITTANTPAINMAINPGSLPQQGTLYKTDGVIDFIQGTANDYPFGLFTSTARVLNCRIYYSTRSGLKYLWNTGDTTATIVVKPDESTVYTVVVYDTSGCKNSDTVSVQVNVAPTVFAGPDTLICDGESYLMQATSTVENVVWTPSVGLSSSAIVNPTFNNNQAVEYVILATDNNGCISSDTVFIDVKNCLAYIQVPQAFTPNNDGVNDYFTLFGNNIERYEIQIFNRWGEMVYASRDLGELNDMSKGWDGTYKGKEQNMGTFVYYLTATDVYGKKHEKKGNLTLIR